MREHELSNKRPRAALHVGGAFQTTERLLRAITEKHCFYYSGEKSTVSAIDTSVVS